MSDQHSEPKADPFAGHTPGPWVALAPLDDADFSVPVVDAEGFYVAHVCALGDDAEQCANAALFAAAPALLSLARDLAAFGAAVEDLLSGYDGTPEEDALLDTVRPLLDRAREMGVGVTL